MKLNMTTALNKSGFVISRVQLIAQNLIILPPLLERYFYI